MRPALAKGCTTLLYRNQSIGLCFHLCAMIQTCAYLYSSNFYRRSILRKTTHHQSLHLQAMLTGETLKG